MKMYDEIRNLDDKNREYFLRDNFLESMRDGALEAIWDLQRQIGQILICNSDYIAKIEIIKERMRNNPSIKIKIEKIMHELEAERLEDLSMFSDTLLNIAEKGE